MDLPKREICRCRCMDDINFSLLDTHSVTKTKERIDRWWRKHPRGRLSTPQVVSKISAFNITPQLTNFHDFVGDI